MTNPKTHSMLKPIKDEEITEIHIIYNRWSDGNQLDIDILWTDKKSAEIMKTIFWILKNEEDFIIDKKGKKNTFDITFQSLLHFFDKRKKSNLEEALEKKIQDLKEPQFLSYRNIETGEIKQLSIEQIINLILKQREERIKFYQEILEEYKKNKADYDERLKKRGNF